MMMDVSHLWLALLVLGISLLARTIYRFYFHPLSHIPGPKLAAATHLYEFYYDICCSGRFLFQIEKLHRQYGISYYTRDIPRLQRTVTDL
jgi:hypothetical protein